MFYGTILLIGAVVNAVLAARVPWLPARFLLGWVALSFAAGSLAYLAGLPGMFFKQATGRVPRAAWLLLWPYYLLNKSAFEFLRLTGREDRYHEIIPGLYLGRRLTRREAAACPLKPTAVVDVTCEMPEAPALCGCGSYLMLPVLDGSAPGVSQLRAGAEHIARHLPAGSVYVHCARGRERSAAVVIAYLLASRRVSTPAEGLAFLRTRRACTGLTRGQARALERFAKELRRAPIPMA